MKIARLAICRPLTFVHPQIPGIAGAEVSHWHLNMSDWLISDGRMIGRKPRKSEYCTMQTTTPLMICDCRIYPALSNVSGYGCRQSDLIFDENTHDRLLLSRFLFYVLSVFVAGLLVPYNHPGLSPKDSNNGMQYVQSSPFIIAMQVAGIKFVGVVRYSITSQNSSSVQLPHITSAFFILSAWSAATSDGEKPCPGPEKGLS